MDSPGDAGPKAESLRLLSEAGLPVPEARFLGVSAYREHAARAGLGDLLGHAAEDPVDPARIRHLIVSTPVDEALSGELRVWYRALGGGNLAVRSSANAEDLPGASFAGQHGTYFVSSAEELIDRVRDCWASLFAERAVRYREHRMIPHGDVAMAVIVQRLVPARAAGVAFTANPLDGTDAVWIEACGGIGEALVSGKVTPDRFVFAREGLVCREIAAGEKHVRIVAGPDGTTEEHVDAAAAGELSIDEDAARKVAVLALRAEEVVGCPVDVEWAFEGERVWLLQARPITTLDGVSEHPSDTPMSRGIEATRATHTAAGPVAIWSNVNTGEILPDVATPMTWTIIHDHADEIFGGMMGAFGVTIDAKKSIGLVGGRIYFNLSLLRDAFGNLPGLDVDVVLGGMHDFVDLPGQDAPRVSRWGQVVAVARAVRVMPGYVARHTPTKAVRFAAHMRARTDTTMCEIAAAPDAAEAYRLVRSLNDDFAEFSDTLAYMAVAMFGFGLLGGLTKRWLGDETGALANRLVAAQGDVASADAGHAMWGLSTLARGAQSVSGPVLVGSGWADVRGRLTAAADAGDAPSSAFLKAWDAFMREHGHHRRGELEFANASWAETPDYVLGIVRSYLAEDRESDPMAAYAQRSVKAELAATEALGRLSGPRRAIFKRVLGWGRASARTRENVKSEAVRWLVAIRHALLALGAGMVEAGVLQRADDVFFLEYGELSELMAGDRSDWRDLVAARRTQHERFETLSPPPVVVGTWDESSGPWTVTRADRTLKGISVSAGVARGPARVFLTVDTDEPVLPGEILVAPFTDPGWTPYFIPAAGIVMDMGGLLSHGSIIAREYGIPAVVNVGPATRIIATGDLIEVDGDRGEVRIL
jgi:phosphohistidine swiveling domain-containing protein